MKSVNAAVWPLPVVEVNGINWVRTDPDHATHVFIWFDRKPMIAIYYSDHKSYLIGNQRMHISNPSKKTNRVIAFVQEWV